MLDDTADPVELLVESPPPDAPLDELVGELVDELLEEPDPPRLSVL